MLCMFTPKLCAVFQPLYHVCADFGQNTGMDNGTVVCNSLPEVTMVSHFNSTHLCAFRNLGSPGK
jgi:hypothetical protein